MTEHPINLKSWEVRAIIDGRKTMTRRLLPNGRRPGPMLPDTNDLRYDPVFREWYCERGRWHAKARWRPGDRLWVRETWAKVGDNEDDIHCCPDLRRWSYYRADDSQPERLKWHSPAVMPRWASRITLLVTGVRVERLQDISEADARAEGMIWQEPTDEDRQWWADRCAEFGDDPDADPIRGVWLAPGTRRGFGLTKEDRNQPVCGPTAASAFRQTWTHLHGPDAWERNDWVSVTKFERVP